MMKKSLGVLVLGAILLTGCGSKDKNLTCTMDQSEMLAGNGKMHAEIILKYEEEKITLEDENLYVEITNEEVTDDEMDLLKDNLETICDNKTANFKSCNVKVKGKKIEFKSQRDINDLNDPDIDENTSYDDAKEILEDRGYSCK